MDAARLEVVVDADTAGAEQGLQRVHQQVSGLGSMFGTSALQGAAFGVGLMAVNAAATAVSGAFQGLIGSGVGLNSSMENVRAQLNAFTKDGAVSSQILAMIRKEADLTPFSFQAMASATAGLMSASRQANEPLMALVKTAEVLAASNPAEGLEGAAFALREAVSGDFTSVIERFNLPRAYINQLKAEGVPALEAVRKAMLSMGYDMDLVSNLSQTLSGRWSTFQDTLAGVQQKLTEPIFDGLKSGLEAAQGWFERNKEAIDIWTTAIKGGVSTAVETVGGWLSSLGGVLDTVFQKLTAGDVSGAIATITDAVGSALQGAVAAVDSFGKAMFGAGWTLMTTLAGGIMQGANDAITAAINYVADLIASFFVGSSPPPSGPLSQIDRAGQTLMETYGEGMKQGLGPVAAAVAAVNEQFTRADLTDALKGMTEQFDASKGHLEQMKAIGGDVEGAIKAIDREVRTLEHSAGAVKYVVDQIKQGFDDQIRPLERQLQLLRGSHDFARDEKAISFEQRDIAIRRQEIAARGNKEAEKAARAARDAFSIEKELYDLGNRQTDLAKKRSEIPLLQQIDQLKQAEDAATTPLQDQLRLMERQKAELGFQKTQWTDLKATIADAVTAATPKGGAGGGGGGGKGGGIGGLKVPAIGAGGGLNLGGAIEKGVDEMKAKMLAWGAGLGEKLTTGMTSYLSTSAPALIGGAAGALIGGAVLGPIGFVAGGLLGARFGEGLTAALKERGVNWDDVMARLQAGAERVTTFIKSIFSGESLATGVNKAFGDLIPPDLNAKLDAIDTAIRNIKASVLELNAATQSGGLSGFFKDLADQIARAGAPETSGALTAALGQVQTALGNVVTIGGTVFGFFGQLATTFAQSSGLSNHWGELLDATIAAVVTTAVQPVVAFNQMVTGTKAAMDAFAPILETWNGLMVTWRDGIVTATVAVSESVKANLDTSKTNLDGLGTKLGEVADLADGWATTVGTAFESARLAIVEKVGEAATAVVDFKDGVVATLVGLVKSAGATAAQIGNSIIDGLIGPLLSRVNEIVEAMLAPVRAGLAAVKNAIKPGSPSKVFEELGKSIVDGLRVGILGNLSSLTTAFDAMTDLFHRSAESLKAPIDALIGHLKQGVSVSGYVKELLSHVNEQTAGHLGDVLRGYFNEYLDGLGKLADGAAPAVQRVQEDLQTALTGAVAEAVRSAQQAVDQAANQMQQAIASLTEGRELRGRRGSFDAGQTAESQARSIQREDAEARYQLEKELARATTDEQRDQIRARFADAEGERTHRRKLAEEDRLFAQSQADQRQAFEDQIADEGLAKQLARIATERDARIAAIQAELKARQDALVATAKTALGRIVEDVNTAINVSIGKLFDNLPEEMKKRGGPTDPAFLGGVRDSIAALIVPLAGMFQSLLANMAGIGNDYGGGVPLGVPAGGAFNPSLVPVTPAAAAPVVVVNVSGQLYGSTADLARVLQPELQRLVRA